jgi:hypothetical protein
MFKCKDLILYWFGNGNSSILVLDAIPTLHIGSQCYNNDVNDDVEYGSCTFESQFYKCEFGVADCYSIIVTI